MPLLPWHPHKRLIRDHWPALSYSQRGYAACLAAIVAVARSSSFVLVRPALAMRASAPLLRAPCEGEFA